MRRRNVEKRRNIVFGSPFSQNRKQKYGRNHANDFAEGDFLFDFVYIRGLCRLLTLCRWAYCITSIVKHWRTCEKWQSPLLYAFRGSGPQMRYLWRGFNFRGPILKRNFSHYNALQFALSRFSAVFKTARGAKLDPEYLCTGSTCKAKVTHLTSLNVICTYWLIKYTEFLH